MRVHVSRCIAAVTQKPSSVVAMPCEWQLLSMAIKDCRRRGLVTGSY